MVKLAKLLKESLPTIGAKVTIKVAQPMGPEMSQTLIGMVTHIDELHKVITIMTNGRSSERTEIKIPIGLIDSIRM